MAKKDKKNKKTGEKREAPDEDAVLNPVRTGPGGWFALLLVPVIVTVYFGITKPKEPPPQQPAPVIAQTESRESTGRSFGRGEVAENESPPAEPACNFEAWNGREMTEEAETEIKELGRPYRVLPPGAMMTMDHSPARVNFEIDEAKVIRRVWCG